MRLIKNIADMHMFSSKAKARGKTIAFVPTMGFLHEGHLSLVEAARKKAEIVVVSIFVNPIQFGPNEDFNRYPKDLNHDKNLLSNYDIDVLFMPEARQMYPEGFKTSVEVADLSKKMCGRNRPEHFKGVVTVVAKLFNIVKPDFAFFGEKDHQQLLIIKKMAKDLSFDIKIFGLPIVREFDGLAMSSRNKYLNEKQRKSALVLYRALMLAKEEIDNGEKDIQKILLRMRSLIGTEPTIRLDYVVIADPDTLEEVKTLKGRLLIALAAQLGPARLIDNIHY